MQIRFKDKKFDEFVQICDGDNICIFTDKDNNIIISAPQINKTNIKNGEFLISGDSVEIEAGRNISITTVHPNKMIIGADFDKENAKIRHLEDRVSNLEKAIALLLREKKCQ